MKPEVRIEMNIDLRTCFFLKCPSHGQNRNQFLYRMLFDKGIEEYDPAKFTNAAKKHLIWWSVLIHPS